MSRETPPAGSKAQTHRPVEAMHAEPGALGLSLQCIRASLFEPPKHQSHVRKYQQTHRNTHILRPSFRYANSSTTVGRCLRVGVLRCRFPLQPSHRLGASPKRCGFKRRAEHLRL